MPDPEGAPERHRKAILDQLRYLIEEAEMLRRVVGRVPVPLQQARALDGLSLRETIALLAALDAGVRLPMLQALAQHRAPDGSAPDAAALVAGANEQSTDALIAALIAARHRLVEAAEALPDAAWSRGALGLLHGVTQEDADHLRTLAQQLFDAQGMGA